MTSSDNNGKGKRGREYPQPSFTLRRITGSTARCSYEIRQKLAVLEYSRLVCADGHSFRPRQEASEGLGTPGGRAQELPERRWFIPHGCKQLTIAGRNTARFFCVPPGGGLFCCEKRPPRGQLKSRGGSFFFFKVPPG